MSSAQTRRALVVGATGIAGQTVSHELMRHGWEVHGLARRTDRLPDGVIPVSADLLDAEATRAAVAGIRPEIVIVTAWIRKDTEAENIEVNSAHVRNLLAALEPDGGVRHVALMTGLKHYLGPFEDYATGGDGRDAVPRGRAAAADTPTSTTRRRTSCSPPPSAWASPGACTARTRSSASPSDNAMNMVLTLSRLRHDLQGARAAVRLPRLGDAVERRHRRHRRRPARRADRLGGDRTRPAENEAFNIANGDVFRWRWLWPQIADALRRRVGGLRERAPRTLEAAMADMAADVVARIAEREGLVEPDVTGSHRGGTATATSVATSSA